MSSVSSPMDYQKHVKVKSRWTKSSQMEMMVEESQSPVDTSDAITDVSASDLNESTDHSSELNSLELRRSRRSRSIKAGYRQINGLKKTEQKKSNKRGRKKKQLPSTSYIDNVDKFKDNTSQECDISNVIQKLNLNEDLLENKSLSTNNGRLSDDNLSIHKDNFQQSNNELHYRHIDEQSNVVLNIIEHNETSTTSCGEQKHSDELNICKCPPDKENIFEINNLMIPNQSELTNLKCNPIYKRKNIRSKSLDGSKTKTVQTFKRCKSYDDINNINYLEIDDFKLQKPLKKRRQSKRIKPKSNCIELLEDMEVPELYYKKVADEIYSEHKNQLIRARINDKEFDQKLKSTNFTLINENLYRPNRQAMKSYHPSEISTLRKLKQRVISGDINDYCECTLSKEDIIEGNIGCDDQCLNRVLKVECGSGCSLKRYCTNKQFQYKQFKKTKIIKTENKGYGICAVEDIPKGVLISEYVGEVIDFPEMCKRLTKKEYANLNYLVQLNADEIIDSTSKGNITRFINHSCDPNSVGEKWHVQGQSRIGFFSTRNIEKGEEITFDYSFQGFGGGAQICYCGSLNCRGYISKASQIIDQSSSEDSDSITENHLTSKPEEKQAKKKNVKRRTIHDKKNKSRRELVRQLQEIANSKTKADQELATLNLNRLMVHITDIESRLHVLTFIREHDMNKRLFMVFSGLSIFHNWMTSNGNESFRLMILDILNELPITNRNTITKSKVLDVVAEWAKIPHDMKTKIESLEYPSTELLKQILPKSDKGEEHSLVEKARDLWKKWIVLKMVFKIPKKIDQHSSIKEINSSKPTADSYPSPMDVTVSDKKMSTFSNTNINRIQNHKTILERKKSKNLYAKKMEQKRKNMFSRKKVTNKWPKQCEEVVKKKSIQNGIHSQALNIFNNCEESKNNNSRIIKQTRWDCSTQVSNITQNTKVNYNMQVPFLKCMPSQTSQQPLNQFPQYYYGQHQTLSSSYMPLNQPIYLNSLPPPLTNQEFQAQKSITSQNNMESLIIKPPDLSPTKVLLKSADNNVFNLINESLRKHYNPDKNTNVNTETNHFNKSCSRPVQSGADLIARIKVISDSFTRQPSKLIKIKNLKQEHKPTKQEKIPLCNTKLKSVCDNKKIIFINEQARMSSNIPSEDLISNSKTIPLSGKNTFANAILNSLLKKVSKEKEIFVPKKFVLTNLNSEVITCDKTDKEIELYKNMTTKKIKKVVAHIKTKNGIASIKKRQWRIKLKGLKRNYDKIPATKRNMMRKGSIHRLASKNCLVNTTKSALKKPSSFNAGDFFKRPKEKRVTFLIDGETFPIFPHSEVRPINLNQNSVKQKPLMKCHPFEIRNEPKSIHQQSTSTTRNDLQFPILEQSIDSINDQIITPIVAKFKASRSRRATLQDNSTELEQFLSQRIHKIPTNFTNVSLDVLKLIPDNKKEMMKVFDYHQAMANIIVSILGSYSKTTCQQGRIRCDEDFKYVAKKINENVLLKELQLKKVDKLKITDSTKEKVTDYVKKYMSRFGEVYKRKSM